VSGKSARVDPLRYRRGGVPVDVIRSWVGATGYHRPMMDPMNPVPVGGYDRPDPDDSDRTEPGRTEEERGRIDLVGYDVAATDGGVGTVEEVTYGAGTGSLVVDTGPWIFGRKVRLPLDAVARVDHGSRTVYLDRTREQVKDVP